MVVDSAPLFQTLSPFSYLPASQLITSIHQKKAAISQTEPCWFDKEAGTANSIAEAAYNDASLIAFSEVWVPGSPNFLWSGSFKENISLVYKAVVENMIYVVFGFSERVQGIFYVAQMFIGPDGNVLPHRRKTKLTNVKRTLFRDSTGDSLKNVVDTPFGNIGMLNCWEHFQPLLKYNTYTQGEQVHIAAWPFNGLYVRNEPWSVCNEANELTMSRDYSLEGQFFMLVTNQPVYLEGVKANSEG